jgi:hypothetical protein
MKEKHTTLLAVTFRVQAQRNGPGRFTVPADICALLGIDKGADVLVSVTSASGTYGPSRKTLKSDREPQPVAEMKDWMTAGETVEVTIRRA